MEERSTGPDSVARMEFDNDSWFSALAYVVEDPQGEPYDVVVARGTFSLRALTGVERAASPGMTHRLVREEEQLPLVTTDEYFGELNESSVRVENDLAQFKPKCDVILIGSAHSPTGEPVPRVDVAIRIDRADPVPGLDAVGNLLSHELVVWGDRRFVRGHAAHLAKGGAPDQAWSLTDAEPFIEQPIRYEHAFGGQLKVYAGDPAADEVPDDKRLSEEARKKHPQGENAPIAHTTCLLNPVGIGFLQRWYEDAAAVESWPAPRIEVPSDLLTVSAWRSLVLGDAREGASAALSPQGLGVITKAWQPRLGRAGTFDAAWLENKWPLMPDDFEMAYWNGAHPSMWCPYLWGGETVTLTNLLPPAVTREEASGRTARFALPKIKVAVHRKAGGEDLGWAGMIIDTLIIDLERETVSLVWRIVITPDQEITDALLGALEEEPPKTPDA